MRVGIHWCFRAEEMCKILLLGLVTTAMVTLGSDMALSQTGTGTPAGTPSFMAIDLNSYGFARSLAHGVSDGQQVGYGTSAGARLAHALLWRGSAGNVVDLNPKGFEYSQAAGISGGQQVGWDSGPSNGGAGLGGFPYHALLWHGTAAGVVDLNPRGFSDSRASGVSDGQQVGWGSGPPTWGRDHALLWRGTAASAVDLNPHGFVQSWAEGTSGGQQVGWGYGPATQGPHALLWRGTAASVVDLNPRGFVQSWAGGVSNGQQVGYGWGPAAGGKDCPHALLWRGSAASVVDLHPRSGFFGCSEAHGTSGGQQVGWGSGSARGGDHALLWRGSAASVVDLHAFLPPGYYESHAYGIDPNGEIVGDGWPRGSDGPHAVLWVPIRKPGHG